MNFDFSFFRKNLQSLELQLADLRNKKLDLQKKRDATNYAPAIREDVKAHVALWITDTGAQYKADLASAAERFARTIAHGNGRELRSLATQVPQDEFMSNSNQIGPALCALLGKQLIQAIHAEIDAMPWPENAIATASRQKLLADIDKDLNDVITLENDLISQAAEVGIRLE